MADIVVGLALSHSPQLHLPPDGWSAYAARDPQFTNLFYERRLWGFDELIEARRETDIPGQINDASFAEKYDTMQSAVAELAATLAAAAPDVLVVVGDDHHEMFTEASMPTLAIYWGESLVSVPKPDSEIFPPAKPAAWALYGTKREVYPCDPKLGRHLIEELNLLGFDVAQFNQQPEGVSVGHTYTVVRNRVMDRDALPLPVVPVVMNTYFPPNRPTPIRSYHFGRALRQAIERYPEDVRVGVIASGGLSHFVVDPELDLGLLRALEQRDEAAIAAMSLEDFQHGTSESLCWFTGGGACEGLSMELLAYVPAYRTIAGTGCGMAMARWT